MQIHKNQSRMHAGWLWAVILTWLITDIAFLGFTSGAWWDAGIYAGMGKFIFSGGQFGMWEFFRPPLWAIVLGAAWKIGLNPASIGIALECLSALGMLMLVYKISEKIHPTSGLMSAVLFGWTPLIFFFTSVQLSDLPSAFLATLATYYLIREKQAHAGFWASVAFLVRFPMGLMIVPMVIYCLIRAADQSDIQENSQTSQSAEKHRSALKLIGSFSVLPILYLISNFFIYGNSFSPLIVGAHFSTSGIINSNPFFYIVSLIEMNPLFMLGIIAIFACAISVRYGVKKSSDPVMLVVLTFVIFLAYFSLSPHKEARYSIAFIPYIAILSGAALTEFLSRSRFAMRNFSNFYGVILMSIITAFTVAGLVGILEYKDDITLPREYVEYYNFLKDKDGVKIISTSPQFSLYSNVRTISVSDTPENLSAALKANAAPAGVADSAKAESSNTKPMNGVSTLSASASYVAIDTCSLYESGDSSRALLNQIISSLSKTALKQYDATAHRSESSCRLLIFKLR